MQKASANELRRRFNTAGYWEAVKAGRMRAVYQDGHLAPPGSREPLGTMSELYAYYSLGPGGQLQAKVAIVHQYTHPDGTIGGSGKPDPKMVLDGGEVYKLDPRLR